jgi:hypothetical protein
VDQREAANRSVAEHIARLRRRLAAGKDEIARQKAVIDETNEYLTGMRHWIEQTERELGNERGRRGDNSADS